MSTTTIGTTIVDLLRPITWGRSCPDSGNPKRALVYRSAILWTILTALGYFAAAKVGLALLAQPEGVAVFWPASGFAAGLLVALGRGAVLPVCIGVFGATVAVNISTDRGVLLALVFGGCNAGEAFLFAALLTHTWSTGFRFRNLPTTAWFFICAALSTATATALAAKAIALATPQSGNFWKIWQSWFASDAVGIVLLAPLLITAMRAIRRPPTRLQIFEGTIALALLIVGVHLLYAQPGDDTNWRSLVPILLLFPMQLWMAARCRAVFAAAGIALLGLLIVWSAISGFGRFGDASVPLADRVIAAQIALTIIALCSLMLVSVVVERRTVEADLRASEERFSKLADSAPGLIYSFRRDENGNISLPFASSGISAVLGFPSAAVATDATAIFACFHPDDYAEVAASIDESARTLTAWHREFRYLHPERGQIWLECHSNPVQEPDGAIIWHGIAQDVSLRKKSDERVHTLLTEVNHRSKNLLSVVNSVATHTMAAPGQFSDTFSKRIASLAASHDLLVSNQWSGVELSDLVQSQLAHFKGLIGTRIRLSGPAVRLKPSAAQCLGMALHELATNASKYGALHNDRGTIDVAWSGGDNLNLAWIERDGPPVVAPAQRGFGHRLIVEMAEYELDGDATLDHPPTGLIWTLTAPMAAVTEDGATRSASA